VHPNARRVGGGAALCNCFVRLDIAELQRRANDQVRKGGWDKWAKQGASS